MPAKDNLSGQFGSDGNVPIKWHHDDDEGASGTAPHKFEWVGDPLNIDIYKDNDKWNFEVEGVPTRYANSDIAWDETFGWGSYRTKQRAMWAAQSIVNQHHEDTLRPHRTTRTGDPDYKQSEVLDRMDKNKKERLKNKNK